VRPFGARSRSYALKPKGASTLPFAVPLALSAVAMKLSRPGIGPGWIDQSGPGDFKLTRVRDRASHFAGDTTAQATLSNGPKPNPASLNAKIIVGELYTPNSVEFALRLRRLKFRPCGKSARVPAKHMVCPPGATQ